ncbi:hypothetical protein ES705_39925 [subsurface metagenome]
MALQIAIRITTGTVKYRITSINNLAICNSKINISSYLKTYHFFFSQKKIFFELRITLLYPIMSNNLPILVYRQNL